MEYVEDEGRNEEEEEDDKIEGEDEGDSSDLTENESDGEDQGDDKDQGMRLPTSHAAKLLVLISHARSCPGRHLSRSHSEVMIRDGEKQLDSLIEFSLILQIDFKGYLIFPRYATLSSI